MTMEDEIVLCCKRHNELRVVIGISSPNAMMDVGHRKDEADLRRCEHEGS